MRHLLAIGAVLALITVAGAQQGKQAKSKQAPGWTVLFDGTSLANWNTIGTANWKLADGIVEANSGNGFLVSKNSYKDFELRAEFWVDEPANSGVYIRCTNPMEL